jgi:hypothetical protein
LGVIENNSNFAAINVSIFIIMTNSATMQGVYVNVPAVDWSLFRELIRKFGWKIETREQMLDRFISSRPAEPTLSEEEIMEEVKAVRYDK